MSKYRKKPVVIEAWHWTFRSGGEDPPAWVTDALWKWPEVGGIAFEPDYIGGARICIATLEGVHVSLPGDFVIQGVKGELYSCKPDIFEMTYEAVV